MRFLPTKSTYLRHQIVLLLLSFGACFSPGTTNARVSFEALQRDGYGMVQLERPEPNMLTVVAIINGRRGRLVVDTGWSDEGITLRADYGKVLTSSVTSVKGTSVSATGHVIGGFQQATADTVLIGNVLMRKVPVLFGTIGGLQHSTSHSTIHADGFVSSGFLRTCSAVVDLHNLRLYLRPPGTGRRAMIGPALKAQGLAEAPFAIVHTNCLVEVEINDARGFMIVDTGATLAGVDERFVSQMKARAYSSRVIGVDAAGVETQTKLTRLRSFRIGGVSVRAPDVRITRFGFYEETHGKLIGLLGMDILGKNGAIIDFGQRKLYFYPL